MKLTTLLARLFVVSVSGSAVCALAAPADSSETASKNSSSPGPSLSVSSAAFRDGDPVPRKYSGDGSDVSPPLQWSGTPANTASIAVLCFDPDAPRGTWYHWILFNIPPTVDNIGEGLPKIARLPNGEEQGTNDFGKPGYNGPAPPPGKLHHYHFRVMALDQKLGLKPGIAKESFLQAVNAHVLSQGEITGTYKR